jgi:pimeloyl-ACP methyl ester carboxylesterase
MNLERANDERAGPPVIFLPGIIMPAGLRYAALVRELGKGVQAFTKELEVYDQDRGGTTYSLDTEAAGLASAADAAGLDRFFLYGHSAGGAIALAFMAANPGRVLALGLDEPASDFDEETKRAWSMQLDAIEALPEKERLPAFMQAQVAPDVELPGPPAGDPPAWMASRPAGIQKFTTALNSHTLEAGAFGAFRGPVYFSFGSRTNPIWRDMCRRLSAAFSSFTSEEYKGLHHLNTSHAAEPARVAATLRRVWSL